jgi:hypothetical protein
MYTHSPEELNANIILANIDQQAVINYYYGYKVPLNTYVLNIFREYKDNSPGAWFEFYNGRLVLVDFADPNTNRLDIIGLTKVFLNYNYTTTLIFLYNKFILGLDIDVDFTKEYDKKINTEKALPKISYLPTPFTAKDKDYWSLRDISRNDLAVDKVSALSYFEFYSYRLRKTIQIKVKKDELCYLYNHYISGAVKIYRPNNKFKFTANVCQDDIGLLQSIRYDETYIIIDKSYKDAKIKQKLGYNVCYLMNEGVYPSKDALWFLSIFDNVYISMDSDYTGLIYSIKLKEYIATFGFNIDIHIIKYDFWNDTDEYYINNKLELIDFLKDNINTDKL